MEGQENQNLNRPQPKQVLPIGQTKPPIESGESAASEDQTEQVVKDSIDRISDQSTQLALDTAQTIETSSLSSESKQQLRDKLKRSLKAILSILSFAGVLIAFQADKFMHQHKLTRYKVESKIANNNETIYTHQDPETTHIINILAGKEKLSESDRKRIASDYLVGELEFFHQKGQFEDISEIDIRKMSSDELDNLAIRFARLKNKPRKLVSYELDSISFDPELYNALWKLEQECGNPKVRFKIRLDKDPRSNYDITTNTITININDDHIGDSYLSELAHGKQFDQEPIYSAFLVNIHDKMKIKIKMLPGSKDKEKSYDELYNEPGTLEYNAHHIIEPKLQSELKALRPKRTAMEKRLEEARIRYIKKYEETRNLYSAKLDKLNNGQEYHKLLKEFQEHIFQINKDFDEEKEAIRLSLVK
jgi:hypothetical protein